MEEPGLCLIKAPPPPHKSPSPLPNIPPPVWAHQQVFLSDRSKWLRGRRGLEEGVEREGVGNRRQVGVTDTSAEVNKVNKALTPGKPGFTPRHQHVFFT